MGEKYFTRLAGKVKGPFTLEELSERAAKNKFSPIHEVSFDRESWTASDPLLLRIRERTSQSRRSRRRQREAAGTPVEAPGEASVVDATPVVEQSTRPVAKHHNADSAPDDPLWYYTIGGTPGPRPISAEKLRQLVHSGRIGPSDLVWCNRLEEWEPLSRQSEFADLLETSSPIETDSGRSLSIQAILSVVFGVVGYLMLLDSTAILVLRMRSAPLVPADSVVVLLLAALDFVAGIGAVVLGHLAILEFHRSPGSRRERHLIVLGLSCGYTTIIVVILLGIAAAISASGT